MVTAMMMYHSTQHNEPSKINIGGRWDHGRGQSSTYRYGGRGGVVEVVEEDTGHMYKWSETGICHQLHQHLLMKRIWCYRGNNVMQPKMMRNVLYSKHLQSLVSQWKLSKATYRMIAHVQKLNLILHMMIVFHILQLRLWRRILWGNW